MSIIDYSAHSEFDFCPGAWYEKYVNRRRKKWPRGQRDDALALGSLVHEGLRVWQLNHVVAIPTEIIDEISPTRECLALATELVYGYTRTYPAEQWPLIHCEEHLLAPLVDDLTLLAKIDSYFYVPDYTSLHSGIEGLEFTLSPGWYIHEYKTKSSDIPIGLYMQSWEMNLQASYQMLALRHHLIGEDRSNPSLDFEDAALNEVQGVLVNVLEKAKKYIPKRRCRACEISYEFYTWIATGKGTYQCPVCGSEQTLQPLKEVVNDRAPSYYRILVTRDTEHLNRDREEIILRGRQMIEMQANGLRSIAWNHRSCVDFRYKKECNYFSAHRNNNDTREDNENFFTEEKDYRGLPSTGG
jgi:hypothetical protein